MTFQEHGTSRVWRRGAGLVGLLSLLLSASDAALAGGEAVKARDLAASCAACHGTHGHAKGDFPKLAGLDRSAFIAALGAFRSGERPATVMHQHARGYTDSEIALMADWFASQGAEGGRH
jgi:sulfide dehydrogenase cytochrome subunit